MEKSDFLYNFTNIYFSEAVKETVLIENWEEGDFQYRYVEYADMFTRASNEYFKKGGVSDEEIIYFLSNNKKNIVNAFNEKISKHFYNELLKQGFDDAAANQFIKSSMPLGGSINPKILELFRSYEERLFEANIGVV